jgi:hypothetical protein
MTKEIKIGNYWKTIYEVNYSPEVAQKVLDKIIEWMGEHSAAHSGEGIMQNDDCLIDAPELISDIIDDILKPKYLREEE